MGGTERGGAHTKGIRSGDRLVLVPLERYWLGECQTAITRLFSQRVWLQEGVKVCPLRPLPNTLEYTKRGPSGVGTIINMLLWGLRNRS